MQNETTANTTGRTVIRHSESERKMVIDAGILLFKSPNHKGITMVELYMQAQRMVLPAERGRAIVYYSTIPADIRTAWADAGIQPQERAPKATSLGVDLGDVLKLVMPSVESRLKVWETEFAQKQLLETHSRITDVTADTLSKFKVEISDFVMTSLAEYSTQINKMAEEWNTCITAMISKINSTAPPPSTRMPAPTSNSEKVKIAICDAQSRSVWREMIEKNVDASAKLVFEDMQHQPPNTLAQYDWVIITRRTPAIWVRAFQQRLGRDKVLDIGKAAAQDIIDAVNERVSLARNSV